MPRTGPSKVPVNIALAALACFGAGLWLSAPPAVFAIRLAALLTSEWHGLGMPMDLPDAMFAMGMAIAATLVASYVRGMGSNDPRGKRYKAR